MTTRPRLVLTVVGLGTFLGAGAGSTVNLALPDIARTLAVPIEVVGWVVSAFLLTSTVLLMLAGRAGDLFSHRKVYLTGTAIMGLASLGCGAAISIEMLIAARIFQGVGGAMVMATSPALLTTSFPAKQRGRALGMLATATYTGLTVGPPLGGWVMALSSWRWVFYLTVPGAAIIAALGLVCLPRAPKREGLGAFDWLGAVTLVVGLPLLLLALAQGRSWGWSSWPVLGSMTAGVLLLAGFIAQQRRSPAPLLDLGLFRSRVFSGSVLSALGNYVTLFVAIILLPFYLIEALEVDAARAGLLLSAQPVMMALVAFPSGRLSDRIGSRGLATGGLIVLAAGTAGMATIGASTSIWAVVGWLAVMGTGTGIFISPNSSALMGSAPRAQQGSAGAVMAVARNLGMVIGVAAATSIYVGAGGRTGQRWGEADYSALQVALWVAAGVSLLSAFAAALRGKPEAKHAPVSR